MNVLEEIRTRHHPTSGSEPRLCRCGEPWGACDAGMATTIGLELYDSVTLSMGHLLNMKRILEEFIPRFERAVAFSEEYDLATWNGLDPDAGHEHLSSGGGEGT